MGDSIDPDDLRVEVSISLYNEAFNLQCEDMRDMSLKEFDEKLYEQYKHNRNLDDLKSEIEAIGYSLGVFAALFVVRDGSKMFI